MTKFVDFLNIKMIEFPEFRQAYKYDCGANAMQALLAFNGIDTSEEEIMREAGTDKVSGTPIEGLKRVADREGLDYSEGTFTIDNLKAHIDKKWPTLIMLQAWGENVVDWSTEWDQGHYVIVIGYDSKRIHFEDPISVKRTYLTYEELEERWRGWDDNDKKIYNWGMVFTNDTAYKANDREHMG